LHAAAACEFRHGLHRACQHHRVGVHHRSIKRFFRLFVFIIAEVFDIIA
jgi:hypothetical protein